MRYTSKFGKLKDTYCIDTNEYNVSIVDGKLVGEPIDRLAEYEDLEEQGLLLRLPCKVGDTVYELQEIRERIQPLEIISVKIGRMGELYFYWELKDGYGIYHNLKGFGLSQIGKDVFLTREEAEKALEKMKAKESGE